MEGNLTATTLGKEGLGLIKVLLVSCALDAVESHKPGPLARLSVLLKTTIFPKKLGRESEQISPKSRSDQQKQTRGFCDETNPTVDTHNSTEGLSQNVGSDLVLRSFSELKGISYSCKSVLP